MPITSLPTAPSRADPATFATRADAHLAALQLFTTQANALEANVNARESLCTSASAVAQGALDAGLADAEANATSAAVSAGLAQAAWTAALAANPDLNPSWRANPSTFAADVTLAAGYNAVSAGPITIGEDVTVTLADTSHWTIV